MKELSGLFKKKKKDVLPSQKIISQLVASKLPRVCLKGHQQKKKKNNPQPAATSKQGFLPNSFSLCAYAATSPGSRVDAPSAPRVQSRRLLSPGPPLQSQAQRGTRRRPAPLPLQRTLQRPPRTSP